MIAPLKVLSKLSEHRRDCYSLITGVLFAPNAALERLEFLVSCFREFRVRHGYAPCDAKVLHTVQDEHRCLRRSNCFDVKEVYPFDVRQKETWARVRWGDDFVIRDLDIFRMADKKTVRGSISKHVWFGVFVCLLLQLANRLILCS